MKLCRNCKEYKQEDCFYKHSKTKDGLFPECKPCNIARTRMWQEQNPDATRKLDNQRYYRNKDKRLQLSKVVYDNREYGGLREVVIERDGSKCVKCGMTRTAHLETWNTDLNVDHINRDRTQNTLSNLQTLCLACHGSKSGLDAKGCPKSRSMPF
jgi:hypothetical protein